MKPVDVLPRIDALKHRLIVNVFWQRQLDKDAVDVLTSVEPIDVIQKLILRHRLVEMNMLRADTDLRSRLHLAPDINRRRRVLTDSNDRQPRLVAKSRDLFF